MLAGRAVGDLVERSDDRALLDPAGALPAAHGRQHAARDRGPVELRAIIGRWRAAVDRALAVLPGDRGCLVRATALRRRLHEAGLHATVRVGVRRTAGAFDAHAWVEVDGEPVGEPLAHVASFVPLDGVTLR